MNFSSLCSLAGRYDNPIPPRFLASIESLKIPAQGRIMGNSRKGRALDMMDRCLVRRGEGRNNKRCYRSYPKIMHCVCILYSYVKRGPNESLSVVVTL
jgi:hypothetical protein